MFERFTPAARDAVATAQARARALAAPAVGAEHLLLGVLAGPDGPAARVLADVGVSEATVLSALHARARAEDQADADALASIGVDLDRVRARAEASFGPAALAAPAPRRGLRARLSGAHLPVLPAARQALVLSLQEATAAGSRSIGTEHLLLGLLGLDGDPVGVLLRHGDVGGEVDGEVDGDVTATARRRLRALVSPAA